MQAPAPRTSREIAAYERRELKKPRVTKKKASAANAGDRLLEQEIEVAVGFSLELAGKERIHWPDTPREASTKIVKLWDLALELKRNIRKLETERSDEEE